MNGNPYVLDFSGLNQGIDSLFQGMRTSRELDQRKSALEALQSLFDPSRTVSDVQYQPGSVGSAPPSASEFSDPSHSFVSLLARGKDVPMQGNDMAPAAPVVPQPNMKPQFDSVQRPLSSDETRQAVLGVLTKYPIGGIPALSTVAQAGQMGDMVQKTSRENFLRKMIAANPNYSAEDKAYLDANPDQYLTLRKMPIEMQNMQLDILKKGGDIALIQQKLNNPEITDYKTFALGWKHDHPNGTDSQLSDAWKQRQMDINAAMAGINGKNYQIVDSVDPDTGQKILKRINKVTNTVDTVEGVAPVQKPLPDTEAQFVANSLSAIKNLREMNLDASGRISGNLGKVEAWAGYNPDAIAFQNAKEHVATVAQNLYTKGAGSDFARENVIKMLPDLGLPKEVNIDRRGRLDDSLTRAIKGRIEQYQKNGYSIPDTLLEDARGLGIDLGVGTAGPSPVTQRTVAPSQGGNIPAAPPAAINALKLWSRGSNAAQAKADFKAKYGYLPEGY